MKGSQKIHHKGKVHLALAASSARAQWRRKLSDTGEPRVWWIHNDEQNFHFHFSQWLHPEEISPLSLLFKESNWEKPYCFEDDLLYKFYIMASFVLLNAMGLILLLTEKQWVHYVDPYILLDRHLHSFDCVSGTCYFSALTWRFGRHTQWCLFC